MGAATDKFEILTRRLKRVAHQVADKANTTNGDFYMLIDLDNANGGWKHKAPDANSSIKRGVRIYALKGKAHSVTAADAYRVDVGVVLRVDGTNADVALVNVDGLENYFPNYLDFTVEDGKLKNAYGGAVVVDTTEIQSDVNLVDPDGNNVLPEVGDVVYRVIANAAAPAGNIALADVVAWYDVF